MKLRPSLDICVRSSDAFRLNPVFCVALPGEAVIEHVVRTPLEGHVTSVAASTLLTARGVKTNGTATSKAARIVTRAVLA
jgi:hypothetical protein